MNNDEFAFTAFGNMLTAWEWIEMTSLTSTFVKYVSREKLREPKLSHYRSRSVRKLLVSLAIEFMLNAKNKMFCLSQMIETCK